MKYLTLILLLAAMAAPALSGDSKAETLKPLGPAEPPASEKTSEADLRSELEKEYRKEFEKRLAEEREQHEASLENLWRSNAAVWLVLLGFVAAQALGARKLKRELERLRALREDKPDS